MTLCSLLACLLLIATAPTDVLAAEPDEQDIDSLESLVTTSASLSKIEVDALSVDLRLVRKQLQDLNKRQAEIDAYQQDAALFAERAQTLQTEIEQLGIAVPGELKQSTDELALTSDTYQLEVKTQQLRLAHFAAREQEFRLNQRAEGISQDMAAAIERLNQSRPRSPGAGSNWDRSRDDNDTSTTRQVKALVDQVGFYVGSESLNLLQQELNTLAPRQTLASLQGRVISLQLEGSTRALNEHWIQLNKIRINAAQKQLFELTKTQETATASSTSTVYRIQWTNTKLALLKQELEILQRTAQATDSIMGIYQIRYVLAQITNAGSLNDSLAGMMRTLRQQLPDSAALSSELKKLQENKRALQVDRILWVSMLRGTDSALHATTSGTVVFQEFSGETLESLVQLVGVANRVSDQMIALETALSEAHTRANEVASTLDASVLWLRTTASVELAWIGNGYRGLRWISSPDTWNGVGSALRSGAADKALSLSLLLLCLLLLVILRPKLLELLRHAAKGVGNVGEDRYWSTPVAIGASLLLVLPLPLVFALLYRALQDVFVVPGSIIPALRDSLLATGTVLAVLLFIKALCRPNGVFRSHFEWNEKAVVRLRRHLSWFVWVCTLYSGVFTLAMLSGRTDLRYGLGVIAFIVGSLAMTALLYVCFRPGKGLVFNLADEQVRERAPIERLGIWVMIAIPALVGLLPLVGYLDTAVEIQSRAFQSVVLLTITVVLISLLLREFMVAHRRMSLRKIREKRAAREADRAAQLNAPVSGNATPDLSLAWDDDYKRIARQAQQLLKLTGLVLFLVAVWLLWKPLFPVLTVFNDIVLWQSKGSTDSIAGNQAITLGKLLFALGLVVLGVVGSRNLRGLLEILVFERMKLDTGARYAINAITSYSLLGTALLLGIAQLGVDWSRLQWIVAALGVGLGFGLQEIVANFISGLIILFERPVRVGDTVTIGGISGTISNIQIRATTLTDFDNREVLLPNKSIITENVTNWTLHDSVTRIMLNIGVAYGSDILHVRELLIQCIERTDDVLRIPEPTVFFVNHGTNSLDFEIRAFVATTAHRLPVAHALNSAINQCLVEHKIDIPFPQHVVHMAPAVLK